MRDDRTTELRIEGAGASCGTAAQRALVVLEALRPVLAYDGAWLGVVDPLTRDYRCLASADLETEALHLPREPTTGGSTGTGHREPVATGPPRAGPPPPSEALVLTRLSAAGRYVGLLALRLRERRVPATGALRRLRELAPVVADSVDPLRSVLAAARLVPGVRAGALVTGAGACLPLLTAEADPLLSPGSPVVALARDRVEGGAVCASFLWPDERPGAPEQLVRITVLPAPADTPPGSSVVVVSDAPTRLRGLTPRELIVLGHLVEGSSNQEIARSLSIAPRTVATHVEHILGKLDAPTRTLAAVRAEQSGLYVPVPAWPSTAGGPAEAVLSPG